jgi:ribosomal protein L29
VKTKQIKQLTTKAIGELEKMVVKTEAELVAIQTDLGSGKVKNVSQLKEKKRDLAQVKTILREKQLTAPVAKPAPAKLAEKKVKVKEKAK